MLISQFDNLSVTRQNTEAALGREQRKPEEREILKFGISLWHIDKHFVLLTARERESEKERERRGEREERERERDS